MVLCEAVAVAAPTIPQEIATRVIPPLRASEPPSGARTSEQLATHPMQAFEIAGEQAATASLLIDARRSASIPVRLGASEHTVRIDASVLDGMLAPAMHASVRESLRQESDADGFVSLPALRARGLDARFDPESLVVFIDIPAELRGVEVISLRDGVPRAAGATAVRPAAVSGFVNGRAALDYQGAPTATSRGTQPLRVELDGALNVRGFVIEGAGAFLGGEAHPWQRGEVRLVADFPDAALRVEAGDLSFPTAGLQGRRPMAGIAVGTRFDLQPYRVIEPAGAREITLDAPSRVEIEVDGRGVKTLHLVPGRYDVRDFTAGNGVHDVRIRIEDDLGRAREVTFGLSLEGGLLARGVHEIYGAVGLPTRAEIGGLDYDARQPTYSGFLRYGMLDTLTLGVHVQGDTDYLVMGGEVTVAGRLGTLRAVGAISASTAEPDDCALRLRYEYFDATPANRWRRRFGVSIASQGQRFTTLGALPSEQASTLEISASVSQHVLSEAMHASLDASRVVGHRHAAGETALGVTLSRHMSPDLELGFTVERRWSAAAGETVRTLAHIAYSGTHVKGRSAHSRTAYDSQDRSVAVDWHVAPDGSASGLRASGRTVSRAGQRERSVRAHYGGARGELELAHDAARPIGPEGARSDRTSVRAAGANVFAGGYLALSRPVANSFAIVVPDRRLAGFTVDVRDTGAGSVASTGALGPAVVPSLLPYHVNTVTVDVPRLPPGMALGEAHFEARPTHKSGVIIAVAPGGLAPPRVARP